MARPTRDIRRRATNIGPLESGDWLLLGSSVLLFFAVVVNWWVSGGHVNAAKFSLAYFVVMLMLIIGTIGLICYPLFQAEASLPAIPLATPPLYLVIGVVMVVASIYELGRYEGVAQPTVSPGFGLYLAIVSSLLYALGALLKWASRQRRDNPS